MNAKQFVKEMWDPDQIRASEYRLVRDFLKEIADELEEGLADDAQLDHLNCVLGEIISYARSAQADIRRARKGGASLSRK